mgnify:CR=1 FL=1
MRYFFGCILFGFILSVFSFFHVFAAETENSGTTREPIRFEISEADESTLAGLTDGDYGTFFRFDEGEIKLISERPAFSLYIVWNEPPKEYSVIAGEKKTNIDDGFMHKLIVLPEGAERSL